MSTQPSNETPLHSPQHKSELTEIIQRLERLEQRLIEKDRKLQRAFHKRHPVLYSAVAFIGVTLMWYGLWDIISVIPIIKNYYVATGLGAVILLTLAQVYYNLV